MEFPLSSSHWPRCGEGFAAVIAVTTVVPFPLIWHTPIWLQALGQSKNFTHCTVETIWLLPGRQCLGSICFIPLKVPGTSKPNQPDYSGMILNVPAKIYILSSWISLSPKLKEKPREKISFFSSVSLHRLLWRSIHRKGNHVPQKIDANGTST